MRRSSISSFLQELTPENEEPLGNIENSALVKMNQKSTKSIYPLEKVKKPILENRSSSPVLSPLSLVAIDNIA